MNKKAITFGVLAIYLFLTASAIYYLIEVLQLSFIMAFLTVTCFFWSITAVGMFLLRSKLYSGLIKLPQDRKERLLTNYTRQFKLYKFILWQPPIYVLIVILIHKYSPDLEIDVINIAVIAVSFYLGAIFSVMNKKHVINILKEN